VIFSISAAKLLYQTVKTCQHLKKNKKYGSAAPAMLPQKKRGDSCSPQKKRPQ
jgi:hypothetical protein